LHAGGAGDEGRTIRAGEGWVEFMPGIEFKMLYRDETTGARSLLARLDPGVAMPAHDHGFPEECLVLQGEITIGDITVCAGDYHFAAKGARHGTLTTRTGALLFLRAGRRSAGSAPSCRR
jgi:quercetin dioxygenase-like cupin family protein